MEETKYCLDELCQENWDKETPECKCGEKNYKKKCKNYIGEKSSITEVLNTTNPDNKAVSMPWHSNAMGELDLEWITAKKRPFIIGIIGHANAGKTTMLAALYMLLRNGNSIDGYTFAGSYTLLGWEKIASFLSFNTHSRVYFPPHTSSNTARLPGLLHLCLKNSNGHFRDILFTDAPGEWFLNWANAADANESKGAKWIDDAADAFIVVADTKAFNTAVGKARVELLKVVERMKNTHQGRPTALVWAKSDEVMAQETKAYITAQVKRNLTNLHSFDIAVINTTTNDLLQNLLTVVQHLITVKAAFKNNLPSITNEKVDDFFFSLRYDDNARE